MCSIIIRQVTTQAVILPTILKTFMINKYVVGSKDFASSVGGVAQQIEELGIAADGSLVASTIARRAFSRHFSRRTNRGRRLRRLGKIIRDDNVKRTPYATRAIMRRAAVRGRVRARPGFIRRLSSYTMQFNNKKPKLRRRRQKNIGFAECRVPDSGFLGGVLRLRSERLHLSAFPCAARGNACAERRRMRQAKKEVKFQKAEIKTAYKQGKMGRHGKLETLRSGPLLGVSRQSFRLSRNGREGGG